MYKPSLTLLWGIALLLHIFFTNSTSMANQDHTADRQLLKGLSQPFSIDFCKNDEKYCRHVRIITKDDCKCGCRGGFFLDPVNKRECNIIPGYLSEAFKCQHWLGEDNGHYGCRCSSQYLVDGGNTSRCIEEKICMVGSNKCQQRCSLSNGKVECSCFDGYFLQADGYTCKECEPPRYGENCSKICECGDRGVCYNLGCACNSPWTGEKCEVDHRKCLCAEGLTCVNTNGSYSCVCPEWLKNENGSCLGIDFCKNDEKYCRHVRIITKDDCKCGCRGGFFLDPVNKRECNIIPGYLSEAFKCQHWLGEDNGHYGCRCSSQYLVDGGNTSRCIEEKICMVGSNKCQQRCSLSNGKVECSCFDGYFLQADGYTCKECEPPRYGENCSKICECGDRGVCYNLGCACNSPWTGEKCEVDHRKCLCAEGLTCVNTNGSYSCVCPEWLKNENGSCLVTESTATIASLPAAVTPVTYKKTTVIPPSLPSFVTHSAHSKSTVLPPSVSSVLTSSRDKENTVISPSFSFVVTASTDMGNNVIPSSLTPVVTLSTDIGNGVTPSSQTPVVPPSTDIGNNEIPSSLSPVVTPSTDIGNDVIPSSLSPVVTPSTDIERNLIPSSLSPVVTPSTDIGNNEIPSSQTPDVTPSTDIRKNEIPSSLTPDVTPSTAIGNNEMLSSLTPVVILSTDIGNDVIPSSQTPVVTPSTGMEISLMWTFLTSVVPENFAFVTESSAVLTTPELYSDGSTESTQPAMPTVSKNTGAKDSSSTFESISEALPASQKLIQILPTKPPVSVSNAVSVTATFDTDSTRVDVMDKETLDHLKSYVSAEMKNQLKEHKAPVVVVSVKDIRKGSIIAELDAIVSPNPVNEPTIAVVVSLVRMMKEQFSLTFGNQQSPLVTIDAEGNLFTANTEACDVLRKLRPCSPSFYCVESDNSFPVCSYNDDDNDNALMLGLGIGIPAFLLLCLIIGFVVYRLIHDKGKKHPKVNQKKANRMDDVDGYMESSIYDICNSEPEYQERGSLLPRASLTPDTASNLSFQSMFSNVSRNPNPIYLDGCVTSPYSISQFNLQKQNYHADARHSLESLHHHQGYIDPWKMSRPRRKSTGTVVPLDKPSRHSATIQHVMERSKDPEYVRRPKSCSVTHDERDSRYLKRSDQTRYVAWDIKPTHGRHSETRRSNQPGRGFERNPPPDY